MLHCSECEYLQLDKNTALIWKWKPLMYQASKVCYTCVGSILVQHTSHHTWVYTLPSKKSTNVLLGPKPSPSSKHFFVTYVTRTNVLPIFNAKFHATHQLSIRGDPGNKVLLAYIHKACQVVIKVILREYITQINNVVV